MDVRTALVAAREWSLDEVDAEEVIGSLASAVERVRELCESRSGLVSAHVVFVTDVLRALDGEAHECDPIECLHASHGPAYPPGHPAMRDAP